LGLLSPKSGTMDYLDANQSIEKKYSTEGAPLGLHMIDDTKSVETNQPQTS